MPGDGPVVRGQIDRLFDAAHQQALGIGFGPVTKTAGKDLNVSFKVGRSNRGTYI
jgi:hypothetical protein